MNKQQKCAVALCISGVASTLCVIAALVVFSSTSVRMAASNDAIPTHAAAPSFPLFAELVEHSETDLSRGVWVTALDVFYGVVDAWRYEPVVSVPVPDDLAAWNYIGSYTISIPSLGVTAPVWLPSSANWKRRNWTMLEEQMQLGLLHGTVAYPHSASPGGEGSLIIAGHSSPPTEVATESAYGSVFADLPDLTVGDTIIIQGDTSVTYVVIEKEVVAPSETDILHQESDRSLLKLITCYPVGTTKDRMIITAEMVEA